MKNSDKITEEENNFRKALKEKQEAIERESYLYGYRSIKDSNMLSQL